MNMRNPIPNMNDCRHLLIRESGAKKWLAYSGEFCMAIVALVGLWLGICVLASL